MSLFEKKVRPVKKNTFLIVINKDNFNFLK